MTTTITAADLIASAKAEWAVAVPLEPGAMVRAREGLWRATEGQPGAREDLRGAIAWAKQDGARLVVLGVVCARAAALMAARSCGAPPSPETIGYFATVVSGAVTRLRVATEEAERDIACEIAGLLDECQPIELVRRVARRHAGPLSAGEVERVVSREASWWLRLHARLEQEAPRV